MNATRKIATKARLQARPLACLARLATAWLLTLAGCATHSERLAEARRAFHLGDLDRAGTLLEAEAQRSSHDADLARLEQSIVHLAAGRPREAEQSLRQVRDRFDFLEQASATEELSALATDERARAYAGEDYEKVLIRTFLALANLMNGGDDAWAYSLQVGEKQQQLIQQLARDVPQAPSWKQVAVGAYLQGVLREQTLGHRNDAHRSYAQVVSWVPEFQGARADLARAQQGRMLPPGHGAVYVFTLVGVGPIKEETRELPSSVALLVADRVLSALGPFTLPPTLVPIPVPRVVLPANEIQGVQVSFGGRVAGVTETITDVGQMAIEQTAASHPRTVARAVVRRVVKKASIVAVKEGTGLSSHPLSNFGMDMLGVAWEGMERADTRCWGLLPARIQVLRLELPAGEHLLELAPRRDDGALGQAVPTTVRVDSNGHTYALAIFPGDRLVGQVLVSRR